MGVLIFGLAVFIGSTFAMMGLYTWARWDYASTKHVRYVPRQYLFACGVGAVLGLLLIAASR